MFIYMVFLLYFTPTVNVLHVIIYNGGIFTLIVILECLFDVVCAMCLFVNIFEINIEMNCDFGIDCWKFIVTILYIGFLIIRLFDTIVNVLIEL